MTLLIEGHDEAPPVWHYIGLPGEGDEPNTANFKGLLLRRFLSLFKIPYSPEGFDTEKLAMEMVGASANTEVTVETRGDSDEITFNGIRIPKVRGEAQSAPRAAAGRKR